MPSKAKARNKSFWTIPDLAEEWDVSPRSVSRWIAAGGIIAHHFGKSVRVSDDDKRAFQARHRDS